MKTMELPTLDKFRALVQQLAEDNDLDMSHIAAALAYENQRERPLFPKLDAIAAPKTRDRDSSREKTRDHKEKFKAREERRAMRKDTDDERETRREEQKSNRGASQQQSATSRSSQRWHRHGDLSSGSR